MDRDIGMCTATLLPDPIAADEAAVRTALDATAAAGFRHVSMWSAHLDLVGRGDGFDAARTVLDDLGLRVSMIEGSTSWVTGAPPQWGPSDDELIEAAAATGATHLLAACLDPAPIGVEVARQGLERLVATARESGVTVCLEFLPWTGVPDLATAWRLVEPIEGAALLVDMFHWQRQPAGPSLELLASVPGDRIAAVQLCDAAEAAGGDTMTEAMTARPLPGDGTVDMGAVMSTVDASGAAPVVTAEIFNTELLEHAGPVETARLVHEACLRL